MLLYRVTGIIPALIVPPEFVTYDAAYPQLPYTVQAHLPPCALDLASAIELGVLTPFPASEVPQHSPRPGLRLLRPTS